MTATYISAGSGQPIIFLHGIGSTGRSWQAQVDHFGRNYLAIGLDLPSYGGTAALPENSFAGLADWLHALIEEKGWHRPILVGNSYGGMIVQEYLYRHPGIAAAAVLFGTSPAFGKKDGEWQKKFIAARLEPLENGLTMAQMAPDMWKSLAGVNALPEGRDAMLADTANVSEDAYRVAVTTLPTFDRRKNLPNIDIPCLLLVGSEDRNAPPKMMQKTGTYIPNSTYTEMEGLGHVAHIENPPVFNAALETFLQANNL